MGDFMKTLFGGGESEQKSQSTTTPINMNDPAIQGVSNPLAGTLKDLLASWGTKGPQYNGATTAAMTGQEGDLVKSIGGQVGNNTTRSNYLDDVLSGKYLPGQDGSNPFLAAATTAMQRTTMDNLTNTLSRALPGRFTQAGQLIQPNSGGNGGSSAFDTAAALAFQSGANAMSDIAARMGSDAYTAERTNQNAAAQLSQNEVKTTIDALTASALPRLIQQYGLDQGVALFNTQTQALLQMLSTIGGIQKPTVGQSGTSMSEGHSETQGGIFPALFPKGLK